jgi:TfoX/Sxy family transcriptional regulator of competence genes
MKPQNFLAVARTCLCSSVADRLTELMFLLHDLQGNNHEKHIVSKDLSVTGIPRTFGKIRFRAHFGGYSLSIDNTVFAMISEGELYLRACEESAQYRVTTRSPLLTIQKRGRAVSLTTTLLMSISGVTCQHCCGFHRNRSRRPGRKTARDTPHRLKDLPKHKLST